MKIVKWLDKNFESAVLVALLVIMAVIMGMQVCARYLFNFSLSWTEEITRYLFVWSGFLSIAFTTQRGIAIRIDQLTGKMGRRGKDLVLLLDYGLEFLFFAYLLPFAWKYTHTAIVSGQVSTACGIPMWMLQSAPAAGFLLTEFRLIEKFIRVCKDIKEEGACQQ